MQNHARNSQVQTIHQESMCWMPQESIKSLSINVFDNYMDEIGVSNQSFYLYVYCLEVWIRWEFVCSKFLCVCVCVCVRACVVCLLMYQCLVYGCISMDYKRCDPIYVEVCGCHPLGEKKLLKLLKNVQGRLKIVFSPKQDTRELCLKRKSQNHQPPRPAAEASPYPLIKY